MKIMLFHISTSTVLSSSYLKFGDFSGFLKVGLAFSLEDGLALATVLVPLDDDA
jgi:hypothetical protein